MSYTPKVSGMYTVEVTVTDSDGGNGERKDAHKCICSRTDREAPPKKPTEADGKVYGETDRKANGKTDGKIVRRADKSDPGGSGSPRDRAGDGSTGYPRARTGLNIKHK